MSVREDFAADLSLADLATGNVGMNRRNGLLMKAEGVALVRGYIEEGIRVLSHGYTGEEEA